MKTKKNYFNDQGFTLFETIIALTIFLITLTVMMPFFNNLHLNTINNEIETGAVTVSQQILDELRQVDTATLPTSGTTTTLPSGASIASITAMNKDYSATIIYCENIAYCNANARNIKVQVSHHGQTIYTVETVYTRFQ